MSRLIPVFLLAACQPQAGPLRRPLNVCTISQSAHFFGRFEVTNTGSSGQLRTTAELVLREPLIASPPVDTHAAGPALAFARNAAPGSPISADLALPRPVTATDSLLLFLVERSLSLRLEDSLAQGVFVREPSGRFVNGWRYEGETALTEAALVAEAQRGSQAFDNGPCAEQFDRPFTLDGG